jgi:hypothetical protein
VAPKLTLIALSAVLLAACAPPPAPPPAPSPPPAPPPAAAPPPPPAEAASTAPIAIRSLSCAELLGASDDDRAAASMFFIGYRAALAKVRGLSIAEIQAIEEKALTICAARPTMAAARAFGQAVMTRGK